MENEKETLRSRPLPIRSIRINPAALHQARVSATLKKKTLGKWLEEAINEKAAQEDTLHKEVGQ
jgi:hypothetical protein